MHSSSSERKRLIKRRILAAFTAVALGFGFAAAGATAANAVALGISIQSTNATTQPSGSTFTYQINLACAGTNAPTCNNAVVSIPLDSAIGMAEWKFDVSGGPSGFIQDWKIVGDDLVITLAASIPAGSSQSIILEVTPPNLTTPNGTTWSLLPSVSSTDPDMNGSTAPAAAKGTATAKVPLTVAKTSDGTFYAHAEQITYTLRATCPTDKPLGSVYAADMTVSDTLPEGLTFVSATPAPTTQTGQALAWVYDTPDSVPVACGGTSADAASETITVIVTVGTVGTDSTDDFTPYENVDNKVEVTANPLGGGEPTSASSSRTVVMLAGTDPEIPGDHRLEKYSAAPLNRAPNNENADRRATYPGRWLPNGDNTRRAASVFDTAPATYTLSPRIQYESFQYEIRDKLPCLQNRSVEGIYTQSDAACADPAFNVLAVRIDFSGASPSGAYAPQYLTVNDTAPKSMVFEASNGNSRGWTIPIEDLGTVTEIVIPRDESQEQRRSDNIQVFGYAHSSVEDGQVLQNRATINWYLGDAMTAIDANGPQVSPPADIFIVNSPQIAVTKSMSNVGSATGTQSRLQLAAGLFSPGVPTADLVITDLLPEQTSLVTDPATVSAQLTRAGQQPITVSAEKLTVELILNHISGRDLIRITLPVAELPAEAGQYILTPSALIVDKPTRPGVYSNTARVFYDHPDLSPICAVGSFTPDDAENVRPIGSQNAGNCEASTSFRTVTSSSGQFQLTKTVQGDYDSSPQQFPAVGHVKLSDGVADYAINWQNTGAPNLTGVVLYDVFPHIGDTGVSEAQSGEPRGSQFRPMLSTVGSVPADVTVSYSTSADACRPEVYPSQNQLTCDNDWTIDAEEIGGFANVLAIRLVSAASYQTGEGFSLGFQMSVPTVDKDLIAWNSVAAFAKTAAGTDLLPTESPKVGITASDDRFTVGKTVNADNAVPGDVLEYEITVGNTGTRESVRTTVHDQLPEGMTFVSADNNGSYDASSRLISWDVPALERDATLVLTVKATVDTYQADDTVINRVTLTTPTDYSPTIVSNPCADDATFSCAKTIVPATVIAVIPPASTADVLGFTGSELPVGAIGAGVLALLLGATLVILRRRSIRA